MNATSSTSSGGGFVPFPTSAIQVGVSAIVQPGPIANATAASKWVGPSSP
jgi:hypothetical protein